MTFIETAAAVAMGVTFAVGGLAAMALLFPKAWHALSDAWGRLVSHMRYGR